METFCFGVFPLIFLFTPRWTVQPPHSAHRHAHHSYELLHTNLLVYVLACDARLCTHGHAKDHSPTHFDIWLCRIGVCPNRYASCRYCAIILWVLKKPPFNAIA